MNNRGDTPIWTIIVFGIIAVVVLVLALIMLSGSSTAGGGKLTDLFGIISVPENVQAKQGASLIDDSCAISSDCASENLACVNSVCIDAVSQDLVIGGVSKCANNYAEYAIHGAEASRDWCVATLKGVTYQVEYNTGLIFYDRAKPQLTADSIVMLNIRDGGNSIPTTPGLSYSDIGQKENPLKLTWLPTNSIHTFEGGPFVCGWYMDSGCSNNGGAVLVRMYRYPTTGEIDE